MFTIFTSIQQFSFLKLGIKLEHRENKIKLKRDKKTEGAENGSTTKRTCCSWQERSSDNSTLVRSFTSVFKSTRCYDALCDLCGSLFPHFPRVLGIQPRFSYMIDSTMNSTCSPNFLLSAKLKCSLLHQDSDFSWQPAFNLLSQELACLTPDPYHPQC